MENVVTVDEMNWTPPTPARKLTTKQISDELDAIAIQWRAYHEGLQGKAGSPGEFLVERMDELEYELVRRRAASSDR